MPRGVAIVGGGVSGLGVAWALHQHPDRFDFRLFEAQAQVGGNAITVDMPQDAGTSIPFDISVTACIPSVYHHILLFMQQHGLKLVDTRFSYSYSVKYRGGVYALDFDYDIRRQLQPEIDKFQKLLRRLRWFGRLNRSRSRLLSALNPYNYVSMGTVLNFGRFSGDFRYKILKPMFVNFLMATNVFDMPASLFSRYLEFFDIETATPMQTWDHGTRRIYEKLSAAFQDKIYLDRPVRKVYRRSSDVVVEDECGRTETFEDVVFACNANQTLQRHHDAVERHRGADRLVRYALGVTDAVQRLGAEGLPALVHGPCQALQGAHRRRHAADLRKERRRFPRRAVTHHQQTDDSGQTDLSGELSSRVRVSHGSDGCGLVR